MLRAVGYGSNCDVSYIRTPSSRENDQLNEDTYFIADLNHFNDGYTATQHTQSRFEEHLVPSLLVSKSQHWSRSLGTQTPGTLTLIFMLNCMQVDTDIHRQMQSRASVSLLLFFFKHRRDILTDAVTRISTSHLLFKADNIQTTAHITFRDTVYLFSDCL